MKSFLSLFERENIRVDPLRGLSVQVCLLLAISVKFCLYRISQHSHGSQLLGAMYLRSNSTLVPWFSIRIVRPWGSQIGHFPEPCPSWRRSLLLPATGSLLVAQSA